MARRNTKSLQAAREHAQGVGRVRETSVAAGVGVVKLTRPPWERMVRLHALIQSEKYPNCRSLGEEFAVSSKTIQRDVDFMRDRMGMPIEYHQSEFGFYYTKPVAHFPMMEISEGEVVAVLIAQQALEQYRGTVFERPLQSACRKLTEALPEMMSVEPRALEAAVSFRQAGGSLPDAEVYAAVSRGVLESREVAFNYHKLGSAQLEWRRVRPYHLGCREGLWYCFAFDLDRQEMRTFALPRMSAVAVSKVKFVRPADFSIQRHLAESFGVFRGTVGEDGAKALVVRLRFDAWAGRLIGERIWHESQVLKRLRDGGVELRLTLANLEEVERWVLSWGGHVEVLAPRRLRERIAQVAWQVWEKAEGGRRKDEA